MFISETFEKLGSIQKEITYISTFYIFNLAVMFTSEGQIRLHLLFRMLPVLLNVLSDAVVDPG